jgi:hypothetical protein
MTTGLSDKTRMNAAAAILILLAVILSCKSASDYSPFGPPDETQKAGEVISSANEDLQKIKVLYEENESMRRELRQALETNNPDQVRDVSDRVIKLIADGTVIAKRALSKIDEALDMNINDTYRNYLDLKKQSLKRQLEAFENYRIAAESLKANYDPRSEEKRSTVTKEFKDRTEKYTADMERARSLSYQANEIWQDNTE